MDESTRHKKHTLNVVFHGLIAFVIWDHCIEILAPDIADHEYKAGAWKQERRLNKGSTYSLLGVEECGMMPKDMPDDKCNAVLQAFDELSRPSERLFCSFIVPFPEKIFHMRPLNCSQPIFGGTDGAELPKTVSAIQGFVYKYHDKCKLRLQDKSPCDTLPWKPIPNTGLDKDKGYINLHVWAESSFNPYGKVGLAHTQMAFKELVGVFPGLDLRIVHNEEFPPPTGHPPMAGLPQEQLLGLWERAQCPRVGKHGVEPEHTDIYNCVPIYVNNSSM